MTSGQGTVPVHGELTTTMAEELTGALIVRSNGALKLTVAAEKWRGGSTGPH
jgi:hypothetical protein